MNNSLPSIVFETEGSGFIIVCAPFYIYAIKWTLFFRFVFSPKKTFIHRVDGD